jgi:C4-dicarboxylate-binding protein DctP
MHRLILGSLFTLLIVMSGCSNNELYGSEDAEDADVTIVFSHNQPLNSPEHDGALKFKEVVEEESEGKVVVEVYPASQLGSLREQVESTQMGEINITMQPSGVVSPFASDVEVLDLPYLWPTDEQKMYEMLDGEIGDEILENIESSMFKGLGYWPGGYKLFTTADTMIKSPDDLEGLTMRVMESPPLIKQYTHWGGNAIPVPYAEVYNALQQGIVDGQENPLQTIYLNNYHEIQDYVIESYHGSMTYMTIANLEWFNNLDEDVQELIVRAEEEGRMEARESLEETEAEFRENIIDSGVNYHELTEEEIEEFRESSKDLWYEIYGDEEHISLLERIIEENDEISE